MRSQHVARGLTALLLAPLFVSSCAFLIPENPSTPRYNKVQGERRVPQENMKTMGNGPQSSMSAPVAPVQQMAMAPQPMVDTSPALAPAPAPIVAMDLPPVDANTQRIAVERMAAEGRSMPSENIQLAGSDYPQLNQVPPAPVRTGPDSDAARLDAVRMQLERDRAAAASTAQQVRDAAAREPSMLGPNGTVPAPEPIMSAPVPAPAPQSFNAPVSVPGEVRGGIATLPPPPPVFAPAPRMAAGPAPIQMDALPMRGPAPAMQTAAVEPIVLRPPVAAAPTPSFVPTPTPVPAPAFRSMPAAAGSFDPMAGAATSYSTASNGYLPASRYRR